MSQFQSAFIPHQNSQAAADKEFIAQMKNKKTSLAEGPNPGQWVTEQKACFQEVGDPSKLRSKLDETRRNDLRASHFAIGNKEGHFSSTMQASYTSQGKSQGAFNAAQAADLKNSHFNIGDGVAHDYNTQHTINYKWVQPKEVTKA